MTRQTWVRRLATLGTIAALPLALTAGTSPANGQQPADAQWATARLVTFKAPGCEGCHLRVYSAVWPSEGVPEVWTSREKTVRDGRVTFAVPAGGTRGLSVSVIAPWEGHTGYVTNVAFKYGNTATGEVITVDRAQAKQRASACWAGTHARRTTLRLITARVSVEGVDGEPTPGTLAFAKVTQRALVPMRTAYDGVLGSQDVNICGKR